MADNTVLSTNVGTGDTIRTLEDGSSIKWPAGVTAFATTVGTPDVLSIVTPTAGLPVRLADGSGYLSALPVTDNGSTLSIDDGAGSLTVDAPVGTPVFVRLSDGSAAITTLPVSLASVPSHAVTNAGTFAVQVDGAALTSLQLIDDAVYTDDVPFTAGSNKVMAAGFRYDDVTPDTVQQGDIGYARMSSRREVFVAVRDAAGNERGLNIDASGNLTANITGTVTVGSHAVTNAGTFVVQENGAALTALQLIDNLVLAEDAAHGSGDPGVQALAVRNDSDTSLAGTTGDYTPLQVDSNGYLKVNIKAGAGSGGTASTDDAAFTAASGSGTPMMGFVTADSVDSGDVGVVGMLANRQLKVTLYDSAGVEAAVGGGTQYDEDAAHSTGSKVTGCGIVRKDAAASLADTDGDYTLPIADANGKLWVNAGGVTLTVDGSGVTQPVSHAALTELAAAIDTEVQCDIVGALPAGTNNIGDVDVLSVVPGTGATNLGKAEDAAHSSGDVGVMGLAVRQDTAAALGGTDGDYQPLITDSTGRLWCNVSNTVTVASHAVTNAGTFAVQVDGTALTRLTDIETNTDALAVVGNGAAATAVRVTVANDSTGVLGTVSTVTSLSQFAGNAIATNNGTASAGTLRVTLASDSTGQVAIASGTVTTVSTLTTLANGQTAHDSAATGSPLRLGAKAETALSGITLVADGDATDLYAGVDGVLITRPHTNLEGISTGNASNTDGTSTQCIASAGAGLKTYLTTIILTNTSSSNIYVEIKDGATTKLTIPVPANGGAVVNLPVPLPGTAATAWNFDPSAATTTVYCSMVGFTSKV